jgi:hypothetical protein
MLTVDGPRPMDSAVITLAEQFGINVRVEDPPIFRDDVKDVTGQIEGKSLTRIVLT